MANKIYLGKGKGVPNYEIVNFYLDVSEIKKEYITLTQKGTKILKCTIAKMQVPDKFGNDYTVFLDTYKPEKPKENDDLAF
jgi:hypothetical protein